jgi:hypothetical protein
VSVPVAVSLEERLDELVRLLESIDQRMGVLNVVTARLADELHQRPPPDQTLDADPIRIFSPNNSAV